MNKKKPLRAAAASRLRTPRARARLARLALLPALSVAPLADAQVMRIEPAINAEVTYSNNGNQGPPGREEPDVAIDVNPQLWLTYRTARLQARGVLGVTTSTYIGGERTSTIYPSIDLTATLQAIRDFFYIDADVVAQRQYESPFAPRSASGDAFSYASYAYRIAPYFQGTLPSWQLRYLLRNDFWWTYATGTRGNQFDDGFEWRIRGELASDWERRYGFVYQYERDYLKYPNSPKFIVEVGRAIGTYRVMPDLTASVRAGYEWEIFPASEGQGAIYGAGLTWLPTPRTKVDGWWEHRFFGGSWLVSAGHRMPWFAFSVASSRQLSTSPQSLFYVPRTANVFTSIDAILTTRIPDPIERARAVQDLLLLTGLPPTLALPVPVFSQRVDLHEAHSLSVGYLGARNSLVADAYYLDRRGIDATGEPLPAPLRIFTDQTQRGTSLTYSRRLARADSINATLLWQETIGSEVTVSRAESTQLTARLQYNQQLRPRTLGYAGVRYIVYNSNVLPDFDELSVFVGIHHRF
jgi:uncharacterized protein (PEP-CTERM system associated)